jgi:DNA-binding transcriptional LysR family regulator
MGAADLARYPLVTGIPDNNLRFSDWITQHAPAARIVQRVNSISGIIASVRAGIGAALLPCIIGDNLKGIVRLMPPIPELATPCWMVTTDQARRQPHIRAVIDCVVDYVERAMAPQRREEGDLKFATR